MNIIFHTLLSINIIELILGNAREYIIPIIIFSTITDFDHIPYIIRNRKNIIKERLGPKSRTRFHEIYGLTVAGILITIISAISIDIAQIAAICIILHHAVDFISDRTRPAYPYSKKEITTGIIPKRQKTRIETKLTIILVIITWLVMRG